MEAQKLEAHMKPARFPRFDTKIEAFLLPNYEGSDSPNADPPSSPMIQW